MFVGEKDKNFCCSIYSAFLPLLKMKSCNFMAMGRSHPLPFEGVCGFRLVSDPCKGDETRSIPELNGGKLLNFIFLNLPEPGYPLFSNTLSISHKMEMCAKVRRCESPFNPVFLTKADQRRRTGRAPPCLKIFKNLFLKISTV